MSTPACKACASSMSSIDRCMSSIHRFLENRIAMIGHSFLVVLLSIYVEAVIDTVHTVAFDTYTLKPTEFQLKQ